MYNGHKNVCRSGGRSENYPLKGAIFMKHEHRVPMKVFSVLLTMVMLLGCITAGLTAFAAEDSYLVLANALKADGMKGVLPTYANSVSPDVKDTLNAKDPGATSAVYAKSEALWTAMEAYWTVAKNVRSTEKANLTVGDTGNVLDGWTGENNTASKISTTILKNLVNGGYLTLTEVNNYNLIEVLGWFEGGYTAENSMLDEPVRGEKDLLIPWTHQVFGSTGYFGVSRTRDEALFAAVNDIDQIPATLVLNRRWSWEHASKYAQNGNFRQYWHELSNMKVEDNVAVNGLNFDAEQADTAALKAALKRWRSQFTKDFLSKDLTGYSVSMLEAFQGLIDTAIADAKAQKITNSLLYFYGLPTYVDVQALTQYVTQQKIIAPYLPIANFFNNPLTENQLEKLSEAEAIALLNEASANYADLVRVSTLNLTAYDGLVQQYGLSLTSAQAYLEFILQGALDAPDADELIEDMYDIISDNRMIWKDNNGYTYDAKILLADLTTRDMTYDEIVDLLQTLILNQAALNGSSVSETNYAESTTWKGLLDTALGAKATSNTVTHAINALLDALNAKDPRLNLNYSGYPAGSGWSGNDARDYDPAENVDKPVIADDEYMPSSTFPSPVLIDPLGDLEDDANYSSVVDFSLVGTPEPDATPGFSPDMPKPVIPTLLTEEEFKEAIVAEMGGEYYLIYSEYTAAYSACLDAIIADIKTLHGGSLSYNLPGDPAANDAAKIAYINTAYSNYKTARAAYSYPPASVVDLKTFTDSYDGRTPVLDATEFAAAVAAGSGTYTYNGVDYGVGDHAVYQAAYEAYWSGLADAWLTKLDDLGLTVNLTLTTAADKIQELKDNDTAYRTAQAPIQYKELLQAQADWKFSNAVADWIDEYTTEHGTGAAEENSKFKDLVGYPAQYKYLVTGDGTTDGLLVRYDELAEYSKLVVKELEDPENAYYWVQTTWERYNNPSYTDPDKTVQWTDFVNAVNTYYALLKKDEFGKYVDTPTAFIDPVTSTAKKAYVPNNPSGVNGGSSVNDGIAEFDAATKRLSAYQSYGTFFNTYRLSLTAERDGVGDQSKSDFTRYLHVNALKTEYLAVKTQLDRFLVSFPDAALATSPVNTYYLDCVQYQTELAAEIAYRALNGIEQFVPGTDPSIIAGYYKEDGTPNKDIANNDYTYDLNNLELYVLIKDSLPPAQLAEIADSIELAQKVLAYVKGFLFVYESLHPALMTGDENDWSKLHPNQDWFPTRNLMDDTIVLDLGTDKFEVKYEHVENLINKLDTLLTSEFLSKTASGLFDFDALLDFGLQGSIAVPASGSDPSFELQGLESNKGLAKPKFNIPDLEGFLILRLGEMRESGQERIVEDPFTGFKITLPPLDTMRNTDRLVDAATETYNERKWIQAYRADVLLYMLHWLFSAIGAGATAGSTQDTSALQLLSFIISMIMPIKHEVKLEYKTTDNQPLTHPGYELVKQDGGIQVSDGNTYTVPGKRSEPLPFYENFTTNAERMGDLTSSFLVYEHISGDQYSVRTYTYAYSSKDLSDTVNSANKDTLKPKDSLLTLGPIYTETKPEDKTLTLYFKQVSEKIVNLVDKTPKESYPVTVKFVEYENPDIELTEYREKTTQTRPYKANIEVGIDFSFQTRTWMDDTFRISEDRRASFKGFYSINGGELMPVSEVADIPDMGGENEKGEALVITLYFQVIEIEYSIEIGEYLTGELETAVTMDLNAAVKPFLTDLLTSAVSNNLYGNMLPNTIIGLYKMICDLVWGILDGPLVKLEGSEEGLIPDQPLFGDMGINALLKFLVTTDNEAPSVNELLNSPTLKKLFEFLAGDGDTVTNLLQLVLCAQITPKDMVNNCWPSFWPEKANPTEAELKALANEPGKEYVEFMGGSIAGIYAFLKDPAMFNGNEATLEAWTKFDTAELPDEDDPTYPSSYALAKANGTLPLSAYFDWGFDALKTETFGKTSEEDILQARAEAQRAAFTDVMSFALSGIAFLLSVVFSETPLNVKLLNTSGAKYVTQVTPGVDRPGPQDKEDHWYYDIIIGMGWLNTLIGWLGLHVDDIYVSNLFGNKSYVGGSGWPNWRGQFDSRAGLEATLTPINAYGRLMIPLFELLNIDPILFGTYQMTDAERKLLKDMELTDDDGAPTGITLGSLEGKQYSEETLNNLMKILGSDIGATVYALNGEPYPESIYETLPAGIDEKEAAQTAIYAVAHILFQSLIEPLLNWLAPIDENLYKHSLGFRPVGKILDLLPNLAYVMENKVIPRLVNSVLDGLVLTVDLSLGGLTGGALGDVIDIVFDLLMDRLGLDGFSSGGDQTDAAIDLISALTGINLNFVKTMLKIPIIGPIVKGMLSGIVSILGSIVGWLVEGLTSLFNNRNNGWGTKQVHYKGMPNATDGNEDWYVTILGGSAESTPGLGVREGTLGSLLGFIAGASVAEALSFELFEGGMQLGAMVSGMLTIENEDDDADGTSANPCKGSYCAAWSKDSGDIVHPDGLMGYLHHMLGINLTGSMAGIINGVLNLVFTEDTNLTAPDLKDLVGMSEEEIVQIYKVIDSVVANESHLEGLIIELFNPQTYPADDFMKYALLDTAKKANSTLNEVNYSDVWTRQKAKYLEENLMFFLDNLWEFLFAEPFLPWLYDLLKDSLGFDITDLYTSENLDAILNLISGLLGGLLGSINLDTMLAKYEMLGPIVRQIQDIVNIDALLESVNYLSFYGAFIEPVYEDYVTADMTDDEKIEAQKAYDEALAAHEAYKAREYAPYPIEPDEIPGIWDDVKRVLTPKAWDTALKDLFGTEEAYEKAVEQYNQDIANYDYRVKNTLPAQSAAFKIMDDKLQALHDKVDGVSGRAEFTEVLYQDVLSPLAPVLKLFLTGGRTVDRDGNRIETIWEGELYPNNGAKDIGFYTPTAKGDPGDGYRYVYNYDRYTVIADEEIGGVKPSESNYVVGKINYDKAEAKKIKETHDPDDTFYTIGVEGDNLTLLEDFFGFSGYDGYRQALIPIYEHLGVPKADIPTYEQFVYRSTDDTPVVLSSYEYQAEDENGVVQDLVWETTVEQGDVEFFAMLIDPVLNLLENIVEDPINELFSMLPNLLYFLLGEGGNSDAPDGDACSNLVQCLNRLLRPITALLDMILPIVGGDPAVLLELVGGLIDLGDTISIGSGISDLVTLNLSQLINSESTGNEKLIIGLPLNISLNSVVDGLLKELLPGLTESLGLDISIEIDQLTDLICGTLEVYKSKNGQNDAVRLEADLMDTLTNLLRTIIGLAFTEDNYAEIRELLAGLLPESIADFVLGLVDGFAGLLMDKTLNGQIGVDLILNIIFYLFYDLDSLVSELLTMRDIYSSRIVQAFEYMAQSKSPQMRRYAERAKRTLDQYYEQMYSSGGVVQPSGFVAFITDFFGKISNFFTSIGNWFMKLLRWLFPYFFND